MRLTGSSRRASCSPKDPVLELGTSRGGRDAGPRVSVGSRPLCIVLQPAPTLSSFGQIAELLEMLAGLRVEVLKYAGLNEASRSPGQWRGSAA